MSCRQLIKYLLTESLEEVANTVDQAVNGGFALYIDNYNRFVLFDPKVFYSVVNSLSGDSAYDDNMNAVKELALKYRDMIDRSMLSDDRNAFSNSLNTFSTVANDFKFNPNDETQQALEQSLYVIGMGFTKYYTAQKRLTYGDTEARVKLKLEMDNIDTILSRANLAFSINDDKDENLKEAVERGMFDSIRGYIALGRSKRCGNLPTWEVNYSAAIKGWGPLTYDIAMSHVHPDYLIADRSSNSTAADKIWQYYLRNRPDVHKEFLEELITGDCTLPESTDDRLKNKLKKAQEFIDNNQDEQDENLFEEIKHMLADIPQAWRYQISSPINVSGLKKNYENFIAQAADEYGVTPNIIRRAATTFFEVHYTVD